MAAKLREHGLVILGKASLTEWSMFRSDNSSHGWNAVFGQIYGAYYPKQCPGGSSGGSAVASDLGLAWATIGTEVGHYKNPLACMTWIQDLLLLLSSARECCVDLQSRHLVAL